jgi:hypothetical protein
LVALPLEKWRALAGSSLPEFVEVLCDVAAAVDLEVYRKSTRGPKKPKPKKTHKKKNVHVSTAKLLAQRKQESAC